MNKYKEIILFVIVLVSTISVILVNVDFDVKREENSEKYIEEKTISKPSSIQAYTLEGEKTNLSYDFLIKNNLINGITCKNGTVATYNKTTNEVSLSNIKIPDYCTMDFKHSIYSKLLADNTTLKTRTDFNTTFTETNTGTLYKTTESIAGSTPKDVYYFAGDAKNNWVKFANFYWRIIRTNHDGSVRLLYAGTSPDTTEGYIGSSAFNTEYNSPKYVGYMYGEDDSTLEGIRANTKDSTIKTYIDNWYSNNLSAYTKYLSKDAVYCNDRQLDNGQTWTYATNQSSQIKFVGYSRIDRDGNGAKAKPTYNCLNSKDAFSGSNVEAKLKYPIALITADELEFAGASTFNALVSPYTWYYNNSKGESIVNDKWWFTMTPLSFVIGEHVQSYVWDVAGKVPATPGRLGHGYVYGETEEKARPVISLKACTLWSQGDGSSGNPYEIVENGGC